MDIIIFIAICLFVKWFVSEWKMSGQKPVDMCFSDDGKKKPWDDALNKKFNVK